MKHEKEEKKKRKKLFHDRIIIEERETP